MDRRGDLRAWVVVVIRPEGHAFVMVSVRERRGQYTTTLGVDRLEIMGARN